jgi:hypothetical protein
VNTETRIARCRRRAVVPSLRAVVSQRCAISNLRPHITANLRGKRGKLRSELRSPITAAASVHRLRYDRNCYVWCLATRARFC